jgi:hypothetical protein
MTSDIVREGKAAWSRVKQGGGTWEDWKAVGYALLEGRAIAARYARPRRVGGHGYWPAFNGWLSDNRLNVPPTDRARLFRVMEMLPAIEAWRETLPQIRRLRMNHPSAVLENYSKATGVKSAPECLRSPSSPAPP